MKTHPPVSAGKVSAGKPVKQFRCGKCRKAFIKGRGYNARTCGKNIKHDSSVRSAASVHPHVLLGGENRVPSISEVDTLLQQKLEKETVSRKPQRTVSQDGTVRWTLDGKLHNPDGPAVEWADGSKDWYRHGKRHNPDGSAVEYADGRKSWYRHGKRHNPDGSAVEYADGYKEWWVNNIRTEHPDLCEKAVLPSLTDEEFYQLCSHEDYVVR